ncbi:WD repeat-containing protein 73 [Trichomycterus rosablanca]|uniref:WD repeat-containing protein 73 n=1 Tax=Trichomycterus rosablanca TaxID=2290929 RepID=UPI002F352BA0
MDLSSDESEDWFIDSLHMYKDLHVFQLEHPTKVIEWTDEKSICVAGYSSAKSEILELLLPLKLYVKGNQGLCPERDFKVLHGGFSDEQVKCLRHVGNRCLVTSGQHSSNLQVWNIGGDQSDVIKKTGVINCTATSATCRKLAARVTGDASVLHGSLVSDVQQTEISSGKVQYAVGTDSMDTVSGLQFVNANTFLICASNGTLYTGDTRDPTIKHYCLQESADGSDWVFGLNTDGTSSDPASCSAARLSSTGQVIVSDLRNPSAPVKQAQLNLNVTGSDFLTVTWAPALDSHLAVSGFDGHMRVFDTVSWTADPEQHPEPTFIHRGHEMSREEKINAATPLVVTTHVWHPQRQRTLLSAASDGSVHVWDWVDKQDENVE